MPSEKGAKGLVQLLARRTSKVAAVALENEPARMEWALRTSGAGHTEPIAAYR